MSWKNINSILVKLLVKDQGSNGSVITRGTVVCCATLVVFVLPEFTFNNIEMMFLSFCGLLILRVTVYHKL